MHVLKAWILVLPLQFSEDNYTAELQYSNTDFGVFSPFLLWRALHKPVQNVNQSLFTGDHCELNIDECSSWPCENKALCLDGIDSYACQCVPGFEGYNCEIDVDECESSPCHNQGECIDDVNGYTCKCVPGFIGKTLVLICHLAL